MLNHGFALSKSPIQRNLDNIQLRDAILNPDGSEPEWPTADVIVGNPPFLGGSKLLAALGNEYVTRLRTLYQGRVPGGADSFRVGGTGPRGGTRLPGADHPQARS
jgi:type II restriction/modification system DNA methylase subunit YeeA